LQFGGISRRSIHTRDANGQPEIVLLRVLLFWPQCQGGAADWSGEMEGELFGQEQ
jgi:hypothetical protein